MRRSHRILAPLLRLALPLTLALAAVGCSDLDELCDEGDEEACELAEEGSEENGATSKEPCTAGELRSCEFGTGIQRCDVVDGAEIATWGPCEAQGLDDDTPIVLSFGEPVRYRQATAAFDLNGSMSVATDWPTAATPWLVLDRDGDGRITDGRELFGSMTPLLGGGVGEHGFIALGELDGDGDGTLTPADPAWASLKVWADRDGDQRSSADELASLDAWGVVAISLSYRVDRRCDDRGNCEGERASLIYRDALGFERVGEAIDVHLRHR